MNDNFKGYKPSLGERFVSFIEKFVPWLFPHVTLGLCIGALYGIRKYGAGGAEDYYTAPLCGALIAAAVAVGAYLAFGRGKSMYDTARLGSFDKGLIYGCWRGADAELLKEAVIDMRTGDLNTALDKFKELEEDELTDDKRAVLSFYMGRCYQLMGYPANGCKYFRESLDMGLTLNDTYLLEARCLTQNGRFDEALDCYNTLLERDCYFDFIHTDMGITYLKKGDGEKALEEFTTAINEGKNYPFALGGCSLAYLQMKDLDKSREYYQKALSCNMDDVMGFKIFYCNIAESVGLLDKIDPEMRRLPERGEIIR